MLVVVAAITGVLAVATFLILLVVSVASRREDADGTVGCPPRGPIEALARRIVGANVHGIDFGRLCGRWADCSLCERGRPPAEKPTT